MKQKQKRRYKKFTKEFVQPILMGIWQLDKYRGRGIFFVDLEKGLHRIYQEMSQMSGV
jgi:hypothetical protein